jgi:hypothetical protein
LTEFDDRAEAEFVTLRGTAQTTISRSNLKNAAPDPEVQPELIATTFGNLTRAEVRGWEKMLGRKLMRSPDDHLA